jgi:hypothetical protein
MNEQSQYLMRAITGPIILITVGVLFALDRFSVVRFRETWPVLLIVIGLLRLAGGGSRFGRRYWGGYYPPQPPPNAPPPPPSWQDPGASR